ncbi:MAG: hypothetical protein H0T46_09415 [Deltaproteobacteria bacterium]|nr:hypothetical protein [Deltaproteobacteria bacterium]
MGSITCATMLAIALVGCSKSSPDKSESGSAAPPAGSAKPSEPAAKAEPTESATVVGPTKTASGTLEVSGAITGSFEWRKKDQKSPISCAWDAAKEIGSTRVDVSDGAGKLITLGIDVPPSDLGLPRLDVMSKDLPAPLKTSFGFNVSGDDTVLITVKFIDAKLGDEKKPDLTIKGTLEVSCPRKK